MPALCQVLCEMLGIQRKAKNNPCRQGVDSLMGARACKQLCTNKVYTEWIGTTRRNQQKGGISIKGDWERLLVVGGIISGTWRKQEIQDTEMRREKILDMWHSRQNCLEAGDGVGGARRSQRVWKGMCVIRFQSQTGFYISHTHTHRPLPRFCTLSLSVLSQRMGNASSSVLWGYGWLSHWSEFLVLKSFKVAFHVVVFV